MLLRQERPGDAGAIDAVHAAAFAAEGGTAPPVEVALVRRLRDDDGWVPALSLVAEGAGGVLVGHVVATLGRLGDVPVPGIGPLGVLPDAQGAGVGTALMHAVVAAADAVGHPAVVLLGDVGYYSRFGFVPASLLGIAAPDPAWGDHFQARPLASWRTDLGGSYRYAAPFDDVS